MVLLELPARVEVSGFGLQCFLLPVVVGRLWFPLTQFAKLSEDGINHLVEAKITKAWSHVLSKVSSTFGNALLWSSYYFCSACTLCFHCPKNLSCCLFFSSPVV